MLTLQRKGAKAWWLLFCAWAWHGRLSDRRYRRLACHQNFHGRLPSLFRRRRNCYDRLRFSIALSVYVPWQGAGHYGIEIAALAEQLVREVLLLFFLDYILRSGLEFVRLRALPVKGPLRLMRRNLCRRPHESTLPAASEPLAVARANASTMCRWSCRSRQLSATSGGRIIADSKVSRISSDIFDDAQANLRVERANNIFAPGNSPE